MVEGARRGRNGPRVNGGGGGWDGDSWKNGAESAGWAGNDSWKSGGPQDVDGGRFGGSRNGGYREGGDSGGGKNGYRDNGNSTNGNSTNGAHRDNNGSFGGGGKNGGFRDNNGSSGKGGAYSSDNGSGGGKNGGYRDNNSYPSLGDTWASKLAESGPARSSPFGAAGPARPSPFGAAGPAAGGYPALGSPGPTGGQRASPFGAAGPAAPSNIAASVGSKYVPPNMRDIMANATAANAVAKPTANAVHGGKNGYEADHGRSGYDRYDGGNYEDRGKYGGGKADDRGKGGKADRGGKANDRMDNGSKGGKADSKGGKADSKGGKADNGSMGDRGGKGGGKADHGGKSQNASQEKGGKSNDKGEGGKKGSKGASGGKGKPAQEDVNGHASAPAPKAKSKSGGSGVVSSTHLSDTKFAELPVSKETKAAMANGFGYELATQVQAVSIPPQLKGQDVVARARTGTGKTLAFMLPVVEALREYPSGVGGTISALVLSPTRELAQQIHDEAKILLDYHGKLGIACFYGGTAIKGDHRHLSSKPVDILVATPGRMQDHLDNTPGFAKRIEELYYLVLDEADQLLETGFRDAILKILTFLPDPKNRQGALFSATFPPAVNEIAKMALKKDHVWLNTVTDEVTPDQISQACAITSIDDMTETLWGAVSSEMARNPKSYKIMVFFVAARVTQLYSEMFNAAGTDVHEIHSRKSQAHRTKAADRFRNEQRGIVFSSDVLARGLDFPDVTAVIQVGVPSGRDQYIHRLGRTGRAGKSGGCILLLHEFESYFLRSISDLPVKRLSGSKPFPGAAAPPDALWWPPEPKTGCQAYQAWLGYYNSAKGLGWKKDHLVREATRFAEAIGALTSDGLPPPIMKKTVGKMGLKGIPGLNLVNTLQYED